jgi:hypothetical protein
VEGAKDSSIKSLRVDQSYRAIAFEVGRDIMFVHVNEHDKAYHWARGRRLKLDTAVKSQLAKAGVLGNREIAARLRNADALGAHRASSWSRMPLVRMVNVSLEPGVGSLDDLVASTERGILMETNRSWSIDDRRLNFQLSVRLLGTAPRKNIPSMTWMPSFFILRFIS